MFGMSNPKNLNTQGIGLGLVISKLIVNKFQGQINFTSIENVGSSFSFSFAVEMVEPENILEPISPPPQLRDEASVSRSRSANQSYDLTEENNPQTTDNQIEIS